MLTFSVGLTAQDQTEISAVNKRTYIGHLTSSHFILTHKRDTVLSLSQDNYFAFKFSDFNEDGFKDIYLEWCGNMPGRFDLYEFIPSTNKFKKVDHFSDFPLATRIRSTKYYYSYYPSGCADEAWGSYLFYIDKMKRAIKLAKIKKDGCAPNDNVVIYKIYGQRQIALATLPITIVDKYKGKKWEFIERYWAEHYHRFL